MVSGLAAPHITPSAARRPDSVPGRTQATMVVEVRGDLDSAGAELDTLFEALERLAQPVAIDVSGAWSTNGTGLRRLCRFRAVRHGAGLGCRLRGLHPGVTANLTDADGAEVFALWADSHLPDAPLPDLGPPETHPDGGHLPLRDR